MPIFNSPLPLKLNIKHFNINTKLLRTPPVATQCFITYNLMLIEPSKCKKLAAITTFINNC